MRQYSTLFTTLYDQPEPVGQLGDAHYSVLRATVWLSRIGRGETLFIHDFAILWDKDHDERVIWIAEKFYEAGLLHHVLLIAEHKATVTVLIDDTDWEDDSTVAKHEKCMQEAVSDSPEDTFTVCVGYFNPKTSNSLYNEHINSILDGGSANIRAHTGWVLQDGNGRSRSRGYLDGIDATWQLGSKWLPGWHRRDLAAGIEAA